MLAYAHTNLLSMFSSLAPEEAVRVATDSIYAHNTAHRKLEGFEAFVAEKACGCGEEFCPHCLFGLPYLPLIARPSGVASSCTCLWNT